MKHSQEHEGTTEKDLSAGFWRRARQKANHIWLNGKLLTPRTCICQNDRLTLVAQPGINGMMIAVIIPVGRITTWTMVGMEGILNAMHVIGLDIKVNSAHITEMLARKSGGLEHWGLITILIIMIWTVVTEATNCQMLIMLILFHFLWRVTLVKYGKN